MYVIVTYELTHDRWAIYLIISVLLVHIPLMLSILLARRLVVSFVDFHVNTSPKLIFYLLSLQWCISFVISFPCFRDPCSCDQAPIVPTYLRFAFSKLLFSFSYLFQAYILDFHLVYSSGWLIFSTDWGPGNIGYH